MNEDVHILLVDDDEIDCLNLTRAFKKNTIMNPLHIAHSGEQAFNLLIGNDEFNKLHIMPLIILLDINMPGMNGLELLTKIRDIERLDIISVYILTTSDEQRDIEAAYKLHVAGYMVKPIVVDKFIKLIAKLKDYWELQQFPQHE